MININWLKVFYVLARLSLYVLIICKVYQEAGLWTSMSIGIISISIGYLEIIGSMRSKTLSGFAKKIGEAFELRDKFMKTKSADELVDEELKRRARDN